MLEKVFHLLTGYARFEITGDSVRFLNMAAKSGFGLWGFSRREGKLCARCRARDYKRLRPLARRCGARLRCVKKRGLPFQLRRLWLRKGMAAGVLCGIGLYFFLSSFVWGVSVSGTEILNDRQVLEAARESGVYVGARKDSFAPRLAAHSIINDLPKLEWASVNTNGCFVEVAVEEGAQKPEITDDLEWSNIVASRAGTVRAIEAERGRPEVVLGDTVREGELLISGLYQERLDPYSPPPKEPFKALGAARGSVTAETYREFTVQVSAVKREQFPTGEKRVNAFLHVFGLRIPLGLNEIPQEECRAYSEISVLTALDTSLPLSLERDVYEFLEEKDETLSEEKLKEAALLKLREAQRAAITPGGRVVREELEYSFPEGMCILSAKCRCEEEIGEVRKVLVNQTESE